MTMDLAVFFCNALVSIMSTSGLYGSSPRNDTKICYGLNPNLQFNANMPHTLPNNKLQSVALIPVAAEAATGSYFVASYDLQWGMRVAMSMANSHFGFNGEPMVCERKE
jgi:hypothetical protein